MGQRVDQLSPFLVMEILERAEELQRSGVDIVHLEVGEPDFPTPACIRDAGLQAIREGHTKYTSSLGLWELREAIAQDYWQRYGVTVNPQQVVVTSGTSPAMLLTFGALLEPGDEVLLPDPHYACYPNFIRFVEGQPIFFPLSAAEGYEYDLDRIRRARTPHTAALLLNSPANPTGALLSRETLAALAEEDLLLISDEIYHGLVYQGQAHSVLEFTDRAFVLNGFSKRYAMTGWRLGYAIAPPEYIRRMQTMAQNFFISPAHFVQYAGWAALRHGEPEVQRMVQEYARRRAYILPALRQLGFGLESEPAGAYYVLAHAGRFAQDSLALARQLLEEAHVAVTPGIDFGPRAEGYLRFSYANTLENIQEGMARLQAYLASPLS